ncbi:MAG: phosphate propanoyltransferase [Bacilli bacterium]|nr:phosphate propanoyltransferase [Bacilli bacterium]MDD7549644.1 phosphate propanoyltransferase [Bacilli bacterium]MDD7598753.1 phosphate propanoyltransferase [Bacilli bacterium]MDY4828312.1 phosphate propanoyltransferase [Bacilli bacterium]MDY5248776.1 phosphate propanoyltransferase [Bacilli bacterium]
MSQKILVETSARHVHVTQEVLEALFGAGHQLVSKKDLSQPGQFASTDKVKVVGPKGELAMSILGPCRDHNQVEVSFSDARALGVSAPVRESGDIASSAPCKLVGPAGEVELKEGVIVAKRHIHMTPKDAEELGVTNGEIVSVKCESKFDRHLIFGDVVVRVSPKYALAMHIDTDECNAGGLAGEVYGEIVR